MSDQLQTVTIHTHSPFGRPRYVSEATAKALPEEKVTKWEITHAEPLIQHELEASRRVAAYGLIGANGITQQDPEMLAKGSAYLELCGKTVTRSGGGQPAETFTPTPDKINAMPKPAVIEFAMLLEFGKLPTPEETEEAGN